MSITEEIKRSLLAYEVQKATTEIKPRGIFLGAIEWKALQEHANEACTFHIPDHVPSEDKRVEFGGVPCFKVDTTTMLFVA